MSTLKDEQNRGHDATAPPQSYFPEADFNDLKQSGLTTTYFNEAHNFAIHGAEFNYVHVEGDHILHHKNEEAPILLTIRANLPHTSHACYDSEMGLRLSRKVCAQNTRVKILAKIEEWATITESESALGYWMCGMAGTGKSTIAMSTCQILKDRGILAGSFFFSRQIPECRNYALVIPTLAYQLAIFSELFAKALRDVLGRNPDLGTKQPNVQLEELLIEPWKVVTESRSLRDHIPVMVMDALDECENISLVLQPLVAAIQRDKLPGLRFFLTSRPEQEIQLTLHSSVTDTLPFQKVLQFILHNVEKNLVQQDIYTYIRTELVSISPTEEQLQILTNLSQTLFIYAATVVKLIKGARSHTRQRKRLADSLKLGNPADMIQLYEDIMSIAISAEELSQMEMDQDWMIVHTIISTGRPLTCNAVAELLLFDVDVVQDLISRLSAVCYISEENQCIFTFHASFPDFISSYESSASGVSYNLKTQHLKLAYGCFRIMRDLKFNICCLPSSFIPDRKVPDLVQKIHENISEALQYSCQFWSYHFIQSEIQESLIQELQVLLKLKGIYWIEVMSLQGLLSQCDQVMGSILMESSKYDAMSGIVPIIRYLRNVLFQFASNEKLRDTTPHLYISVLPFLGNSEGYKPLMKRCVRPNRRSNIQYMPGALLKELKGHQGRVFSVSFSPDGTKIVSGSSDNTVRVWDVMTGAQIGDPLYGHYSWVFSAAFSPDGTRIASGSRDETVRIWGVSTGIQIGNRLQGHHSVVLSVAFSPDGNRIVSGSADTTVRVWDATNRAQIGHSLRGHKHWVSSVTFSPDGSRIISAARDRTVRIWDATTGNQVGILQGHDDGVYSVVFSFDGTKIISGSSDRTVRIWGATTGTQIGQSLQGHEDLVRSVDLSPDGTTIVSGSDKTVRMWDATTGTQIGNTLDGHQSTISSVSFSPDGTRFVSGSYDRIVRIWDATIVAQVRQAGFENHTARDQQADEIQKDLDFSVASYPDGTRTVSSSSDGFSHGHNCMVTCVAFSPDGTRIVSGSYDNTMRIWDAKAGTQIVPLHGHNDGVMSVAFSPDGTRIVSGSDDSTVRIWDATVGIQIGDPINGHNDWVTSVAFSPHGTRIVSGSYDHTVRIWDATTRAQISYPMYGHDKPVTSVAFSSDGTRIVSGSWDKTVRIWDATNQTQIGTLHGHNEWVTSVAFSPDSSKIVSGSNDNTVRIWGASTGTQIGMPLHGHNHWVLAVAFSLDGTRIVSGSHDTTIRIWDVRNRTQIGDTLHGHDAWVNSVAFSPDGTRIASGSDDATVRIWDASMLTLDQYSTARLTWTLYADGWIRTPKHENIVWLPPQWRKPVWSPWTTCIISQQEYTKLPADIVYGENWMHCVDD